MRGEIDWSTHDDQWHQKNERQAIISTQIYLKMLKLVKTTQTDASEKVNPNELKTKINSSIGVHLEFAKKQEEDEKKKLIVEKKKMTRKEALRQYQMRKSQRINKKIDLEKWEGRTNKRKKNSINEVIEISQESGKKQKPTTDHFALFTALCSQKEVAKEKDQIEIIQQQDDQEPFQQIVFESKCHRKPKFSFKSLVSTVRFEVHPLVKSILKYPFSAKLNEEEGFEPISDSFKTEREYQDVMYKMIHRELIADTHHRLSKVGQDSSIQCIEVNIINFKLNNENQTQITINSTEQNLKTVEEWKMAKCRIGVLTNCEKQVKNNYGLPSPNNQDKFAILCYIHTPQSKQEMIESQGTLKLICQIQSTQLKLILSNNEATIKLYDLDKLSTQIRQYSAISHIFYSELGSPILHPKIIKKFNNPIQNQQILLPFLNQISYQFNDAQNQALQKISCMHSGIALVQGPPGTGKTTTLMGCLSVQYYYYRSGYQTQNKIMICAPSNMAIDHIGKIIMQEGLYGQGGRRVFPKVIRTGIIEDKDGIISKISLDSLAEKQLKKEKQIDNRTIVQLKEKLIALNKQLKAGSQRQNLRQEIKEIEHRLACESNERIPDKRKLKEIESRLLTQAQIILTTLSSSGSEKLDQLKDQIGCLIIDEAAQSTEPNTLIPFQMGMEKVILFGDPCQLPATLINQRLSKYKFDRSLFERIIDNGHEPYFLNVQYRMNPKIRQFPSNAFYSGRLIDGPNIVERQNNNLEPILKPFVRDSVVFIDIKYGKQNHIINSYCNRGEMLAVTKIMNIVFKNSSNSTIGVITPYQAQRKFLMQKMNNYNNRLMINTADSFQGQEKDIIIISTVRSNEKNLIGFLKDDRRTNVALTRARYLLVVVGNGNCLSSSGTWQKFIEWNKDKKSYYELNSEMELDKTLNAIFPICV